MNKKLVFVVLLSLILLSIVGCGQDKEIMEEKENQITEKITMQDSLSDVKDRLIKASTYDEMDPNKKSMDESLEYVKSVLPEGIKEVAKNYKKEKGVTEIIYEVDEFEFTVNYIHPFKKGGNNVDEYDLECTSGTIFSGICFRNNRVY